MEVFFNTLSEEKKKIVKQIFVDYYWISEEMIKHSKDVDWKKHIYNRLLKLNFTPSQIYDLQTNYDFDEFDMPIGTTPSKYVLDYYDQVVKNNIEWIIGYYDWFVKKHMSDPTYDFEKLYEA